VPGTLPSHGYERSLDPRINGGAPAPAGQAEPDDALSRRGFLRGGKQFPDTAPIATKHGQVIPARYMNEGVMMRPWHLHGMPMRVIARDGHPLGSAEFSCDTLGVNPRRAVGRAHRVQVPRGVGVPLPHPAAR
jgi:FtsP/CotA-like multicopper oxidase with cupredoxin domain